MLVHLQCRTCKTINNSSVLQSIKCQFNETVGHPTWEKEIKNIHLQLTEAWKLSWRLISLYPHKNIFFHTMNWCCSILDVFCLRTDLYLQISLSCVPAFNWEILFSPVFSGVWQLVLQLYLPGILHHLLPLKVKLSFNRPINATIWTFFPFQLWYKKTGLWTTLLPSVLDTLKVLIDFAGIQKFLRSSGRNASYQNMFLLK